ncbi:cytochrome P450 77A2-like [Magnolia sinica]|uniref:cytochrome P450 77A2-like n=1 Tax=Magnolia sinica TaxID=86752 RepID=UPI0026597FF7|nr:cytochrome P450 77A2-like [Magnolia sinica]
MASFSPSWENFPSSYKHLSFTFIAFLVSALILFFSRKSKPKSLNLPPGPPGWPIVGNLFQVARSGKQFIHYVRDLSPIYGPIFTLKMGARTLIIICNPDLAHEALIQKGPAFASRPPETPTRRIFSCDKFTVNSSVYGPVWRSLRRNMVSNMLSTTRIRGFRGVRESAMDRFIERLRSESESAHPDSTPGSVEVLNNVRFAVFCILLSICFGLDMDEKTIVKIDLVMRKVLIALMPRIDDYLPLLRPFFTKQQKQVLEVRDEQIRTLVPYINQRRLELKEPSPDKKSASFAYLDTLFDLKIEGRTSVPTDAELVSLVSEFLNGGTDTTATAIEWGIARLIDQPDIQTKLYQEIVSVVGDRKVEEEDVDKMPYLNAFTKELLRKHPPTFFALTHAVIEPTTLGGYDIPKNADVEFHLPSMSEDSKRWSDPKRFDPERFISGHEDADMTGVTEIKMMPFGAGRRICPGLSMATLHINLMVARMVQEFEWSNVDPTRRTLDFSEKLIFTVVMNTPLRAVIKPRK